MKAAFYLPALALLALANPVAAAPGGPIGTLELGNYICELPGDAAGPAGRHVPEQDFRVINDSSYAVGPVRGNYLMTGDRVTITSGPKYGQRFRRQTTNFLRALDSAGNDSDLHCVLGVSNNR